MTHYKVLIRKTPEVLESEINKWAARNYEVCAIDHTPGTYLAIMGFACKNIAEFRRMEELDRRGYAIQIDEN